MKLAPGFPWQKQHSARRYFSPEQKKTFCNAENGTFRKVDQNIWKLCRRRMKKIIWIDRVKEEAMLHQITEAWKMLNTVK
jgi:hypothetical protein